MYTDVRQLICRAACCGVLMMPTTLWAEPSQAVDQMQLATQLELPRLVDLASERLAVKVEYDPAVLKGTVALRGLDALNGEQLWDLTNQLLASRGFTTVRPPGAATYSVVRLNDAAALAGLGGLPTLVEQAQQDGNSPAVDIQGNTQTIRPDAGVAGVPPAGFNADVVRLEHLAPKDAADAVRLVLSKTGSTATPLAKNLLIIADLTPRIADAKRLLAWLDRPTEAGLVDEIPLKNISATALVSLANQIGGKRDASAVGAAAGGAGSGRTPGDLIAAPGGGSVILVCPPEHAAYWKALIAQLDRREGVVTTTYSPRVFSVRDVASLLDQAVRPTGTGGAGGSGSDDRWKVVQDELTGSLIITATPGQHDQVVALLERLESSPRGGARPMKSFPIRNRPVGDVVATLTKLIDAGALQIDETGSGGTPAASNPSQNQRSYSVPLNGSGPGGQTSPFGSNSANTARAERGSVASSSGSPMPTSTASLRGELSLTADEGTNTIIAIAEPRRLTQLEDLIRSLDVRQSQVMLEAYLVSLSESQSRDLGVEVERLSSIGSANVRLSSLFGLSSASGSTRAVGDSAGGTASVLDPGEFSLIVKALETVTSGRSLSLPKVLVNNNETANFSSVLQQPFATTNASSSQVTTTTFGGTQDAGTTIQVRPQIAEADHLVLQYSLTLSSFSGNGSNGLPPPRQQNNVSSTATIPDGHTVVVGGLELTGDSDTDKRVPLLGDIPVLGEFFKNRSTGITKTKFFVFIRANVMRDATFSDLKYVSGKDTARATIDDGWPLVEPRIVR